MLACYRLAALLANDRRGVTSVEYAVVAGVLVVLIVTAFTTLGNGIVSVLTGVVGSMGPG